MMRHNPPRFHRQEAYAAVPEHLQVQHRHHLSSSIRPPSRLQRLSNAMATLLVLGLFCGLTLAQYPPPRSSAGLKTIKSPIDGDISISYKNPPAGTCKSAYDWQQQYTGWVHIPGVYDTNTFFWFVEAREPTEQLTVWLNGGPGTSSMLGLWQENGPCEVIEEAEGVLGTQVREWGWDRASHLLYIDQVCFSMGRARMLKLTVG